MEHREADVRYPVVADPAVIEDFRSWRGDANMDYSGWNYEADPANKIKVSYGQGSLGRGLYLFNRTTTQPYLAGDTRRWFFNVLGFGDAYIYRSDFTDMYHTASNSCTTEGIFSRSSAAYEPGAYAEQCASYGDYRTHTVCTRGDCQPTDPAGARAASTGNAAMFGVRMAGPATGSNFTGYAGGAAIYQYDTVKPVMASAGFPTGWIERADGLTVRGTDSGLGMRQVELSSPAKPDWSQNQVKQPFPSCYDRKNRCAKIVETNTFSTDGLPEGVIPIRATGLDVIGDTTTTDFPIKIDRTEPLFRLSGSFNERSHAQALDGRSYRLKVDAVDWADSDDEREVNAATGTRSGVKDIEIKIDGQRAYYDSQPCPEGNCAMVREWEFQSALYSEGKHRVEVIVRDHAGIPSRETWLFRVVQPATAAHSDVRTLDWGAPIRVTGAAAQDHAGYVTTNAGDVNEDGAQDVAISAPGADPNGRTDAGAVYVIYGGASTPRVIDLASFNPSLGFRIDGARAGDFAGTSVARVGDVNGDGLEDLALGAPRVNPFIPGASLPLERGSAFVVFGRDGAPSDVDLSNLGTHGFRIDGPPPAATDISPPGLATRGFGGSIGEALPHSLGGNEDLNDDGFADVLLGSSREQSGNGAVYVIFGKSGTDSVDAANLGTNGFRVAGRPGEGAGYSVAFVGDMNGDDTAELLITAPGYNVTGRISPGPRTWCMVSKVAIQ